MREECWLLPAALWVPKLPMGAGKEPNPCLPQSMLRAGAATEPPSALPCEGGDIVVEL